MQAVEASVAWLEKARLTGIRVAKQKDKTWIHTVSSKGDSSDPFASLMQGVSDSKLAAAFSDPTTGVADATADSAATFRGEPTAVKSSSNAIKRLSKEEASPSRIATKPPKSGPKNTADKPDEIAIRGNAEHTAFTYGPFKRSKH